MKKIILILILICLSSPAFAEDKFSTDVIPQLTAEEKRDAPELYSGDVYPPWGVPCTNFTYHVMYKDKENRAPEYVRINLNGEWYDMTKTKGDYKTGATYTYNIVPDSGKQLFYYYEASNGVGKARTSIIDTPDLGPLLFSEKLDNNQIILLDKQGNKVWNFEMGRDWTEGVAISKDGNYIAVVTQTYIYLFSKESNIPLWFFCKECKLPPVISGAAGGVAISQHGDYITGTLGDNLYFFEKESNEPIWTANIEGGAIGADMSDDGTRIATGGGNAEGGQGQKIFLFDKEANKLLEYKPEHPGYDQTGDFYQPDVTPDGKYVAISTGCPDRRAYLFSGEGNLLFRSEQLTEDSPVHKSAISDDGSLIAYSLDHSQGKEILFLFDNKGNKLWSFSSQRSSTARAVSISGDGNYVAIGTTTGHIYLFSKDSNKPKWDFTDFGFFSHFGDIKLNQDGSLLAAGGTTKKVYLFSKNSNKPLWEYQVNTWINKIDFNGEYIVAGTGPREYFGEGKSLSDDKVECKEIIQPPPMEETLGMCGDGRCISPTETSENCPQDCLGDTIKEDTGQPRKSICGNGICEDWTETYENCPHDCCPPSGCVDDNFEDENDIDNKRIDDGNNVEGLFSKIISFFKRLFGIGTDVDKGGGESPEQPETTTTQELLEKTGTTEPEPTKEWEVYNPETGETELVDGPGTETVESTTASEGDELLKATCQNAINDYPEWTKTKSDVVVWEDSKDKKFYFRNSCEDLSMGMNSPAGASEVLADIDFIEENTVGYVKKGQKWQIGSFLLNNPDTSMIYEKSEPISSIDVSFIDKNTFIMFYITDDGEVSLKYVKNSGEEALFETSPGNGNQKLAVSPKATYAYLLYDKILRVFDISTKTKIDEINTVSSVVWIGDSHLLYSNSGGTHIYDVESKNSNKITKMNTADILTFNPKSGGIIAYTTNSKANIVNCQTWEILGTYENGEIKTFADERTAILTKEDLSTSGYWRFEGDWYIKLSDEFSLFNSHTLLATVWSKY